MEVVFLVMVVFGAAHAVVGGTNRARRALAGVYRRRLAAAAARGRTRPSAPGRRVGAAAGAVVFGAVETSRGFAAGLKEGWPEGRVRGREWWARRVESRETTAAAGETEVETGGETASETAGETRGETSGEGVSPAAAVGSLPASVPQNTHVAGATMQTGVAPDAATRRGRLRAVPDAGGVHGKTPTGGGTAGTEKTEESKMTMDGGGGVAIATVTGGEVLSMDQLIAELTGIEQEASASLEDALADAQRATEDGQRVELMVASLRALNLDEQTLTEVGALADASSARQAAADQRAAAEEARAAQAAAARAGVQQRHQTMLEAHAATPHAAEKAFYTAG